MSDPWARVPIELLQLVDANALRAYVALCKYADKEGRCWASNARLADDLDCSERAVVRALNELAAARVIRKRGRQRRVLTIAFLSDSTVTYSDALSDIPVTSKVTRLSHETRSDEPEETSALRADASESESTMQAAADEPLFDVEVEERETPIGHACLAAFFEAYGTQPIATSARARLGKEFKRLAETYSREELVSIARVLGQRKVTAPNAIEGWLLRARQQSEQSRQGWSKLTADTYAQLPDPFARVSGV